MDELARYPAQAMLNVLLCAAAAEPSSPPLAAPPEPPSLFGPHDFIPLTTFYSSGDRLAASSLPSEALTQLTQLTQLTHPQIEHDGLLHVWDDALPPELCSDLNALFRDFEWHFDKTSQGDGAQQRTFTYARGELWSDYSASSGVAAADTSAPDVGATAIINRLWPVLESLVSERTPLARDRDQLPQSLRRHSLRLVRAYANGLNPGLDGTAHYDDGDFTFMYYPMAHDETPWRPEDGGETMFRSVSGDKIIGGVLPRYNRIVAFDTSLSHSAKAPSSTFNGARRLFRGLRISLVLKTVTTPVANRSCGGDAEKSCGFWASVGFCDANGAYMRRACSASCAGECSTADETPRYRWPRLQVIGGERISQDYHRISRELMSTDETISNLFNYLIPDEHMSILERSRRLKIWDGALSPQASAALDMALSKAFPWQWGAPHIAHANAAGAFLASRTQLERVAPKALGELLSVVGAVLREIRLSSGPDLVVSSVEAIGQNVGMDVWRPKAPGGFSFLYYLLDGPTPAWRDADGGETTFWNREGSRVLGGVMPRHNRLICWNSEALGGHMERGPSALSPRQLRRSILIRALPPKLPEVIVGRSKEVITGGTTLKVIMASEAPAPTELQSMAAGHGVA